MYTGLIFIIYVNKRFMKDLIFIIYVNKRFMKYKCLLT